jgi:small subunit ribosomal protein S20
MAHHPSAIRQQRRSVRRQTVNKKNKSALRTQVKKIRELIEAKDKDNAKKLLPEVFSTIDKTVKKGTIHKNKGSRFKSRLSREVESVTAAPAK